jgi:acetyl esterase/lipase
MFLEYDGRVTDVAYNLGDEARESVRYDKCARTRRKSVNSQTFSFLAGLLLTAGMIRGAEPQQIVLRPDLPAGEEWYTPPADNQHVKSPTEKWVRKVTQPVMEVHPAAKPNGTAVVVAPGGGFSILAIEHEGRDVARWLNERGVSAFVLRYRVARKPRS